MELTLLRFDCVGSTNTEALDHARRGADEGLCIVAREQTAGRGRYSRDWISGRDAGLYFSIVLRPRLEPALLPLITLMSAVAVFELLTELGLKPDIKWPNDLLVNEKKISGILAETAQTPKGLAAVVGIGINLRSPDVHPELAETATSIEFETRTAPNVEELLLSLTRFLTEYYALLHTPNGPAEIRRAWSERSSFADGKQVRVVMANKTVIGTTLGIESNGALKVESADGSIEIVNAGDVEKLRPA